MSVIAFNAAQDTRFANICKTLGPFVPMQERSEQFCQSSGLDSNPKKCALLDAVEAALIKAYDSLGEAKCMDFKQTEANAKSPSGG
jgi:hypothetical protein